MKNYVKMIFVFSLHFLCVFCLPFFYSHAQASEKVKVGYYYDGGFMRQDLLGNYSGFNFEYLQQIAKYTGWEYEVVDCGSFENAYEQLKTGEIDLLPSLFYSEERTEDFIYSSSPLCNIYTSLNVTLDNTDYDYEDFDSFQGMTVGVIKGSMDAVYFEDYCKENRLSVSIVPFETTSLLQSKLNDGSVDAIAVTYMGKGTSFKSIAQFSPSPLYMGISKKSPELAGMVNSAINEIQLRAPNYNSELYNKYFAPDQMELPVFSREEKEFIQNSGAFSAMYCASWYPLEYQDPKTGEFKGVVADVFQKITDVSGLKFKFKCDNDYANVLLSAQNGSCDIVCSSASDFAWGAENGITTTSSFLKLPIVIISQGENGGKRVALPGGTMLSSKITADNSNQDFEFTYYPTAKDCFDALLRNEADITYANTSVSDYLLSDKTYSNFHVATLTDYNDELCIGLSKQADPLLFSIIDKCLKYLSSNEVNEMILKNSLASRTYSLNSLIKQYPFESMGIASILFLFVISLLIWALIVKTKANRKIHNIMYRDSLTQLWNLSKFQLESKKLLEKNTDKGYAFLYIDINQFKTINDSFGFEEGDSLLCSFAKVLRESLGEQEYCARVSADQFVMLIRYYSWKRLTQRTSSMNQKINDDLNAMHKLYHLIIIFGVYVVESYHGQDISLMLDLANYARRSAKTTHKSITIKYDEAMRKEELEQHELANHMYEALDNHEFSAYLQPKYDMSNKKIIGAEALVRWFDSKGELHMPGSFIPFFEKNGFITEIDYYIFEEVCKAIRSWMDEGLPILPVSSNFSRNHLANSDILQKLSDIADKYQVPHHYLEIEITESAVMEDPSHSPDIISSLKDLGFLISIDDFGSGYSSLGMLQNLFIDVVKLDRSFLQEGISEQRKQIIIQGIIKVIKGLGISIICEGVRDQKQADMLMEMGCFKAQSFFYAKPMPIEQYTTLLREHLW